VAENLTDTSLELRDRDLREFARKLAARAVLRRAFELVGPLATARRTVREDLAEAWRGELDEEETLERVLGKDFPEPGDWVGLRRENRRVQVALMMDTSLSMSGRNLALAAVAAAVLAFKVRSEDLAVVAFESAAKVLSRLGDGDRTARIVEGILAQPARGFTNIEEALATGRAELARGDNPRQVGLLISDGVFTAGGDPTREAARFPRLHVLLTEDYTMDEALARRMARLGRGSVFTVKGYDDLPRRMLEVANRILR
jgi:Mg-chelatase subunit ChlD